MKSGLAEVATAKGHLSLGLSVVVSGACLVGLGFGVLAASLTAGGELTCAVAIATGIQAMKKAMTRVIVRMNRFISVYIEKRHGEMIKLSMPARRAR
jgi:hypothetical protein